MTRIQDVSVQRTHGTEVATDARAKDIHNKKPRAPAGDSLQQASELKKTQRLKSVVGGRTKVNHSGAQRRGTATLSEVRSLPLPSKADLKVAARGTAPTWMPIQQFSHAALSSLQFIFPATANVRAEVSEAATAQAGVVSGAQGEQVSLEGLLRLRLSDQKSFESLVRDFGGQVLRLSEHGSLEMNPFKVRDEKQWSAQNQVSVSEYAGAQSEASGDHETSLAAQESDADGGGQSSPNEDEASEQEQAEHEQPHDEDTHGAEVVVLSGNAEALVPDWSNESELLLSANVKSEQQQSAAIKENSTLISLAGTQSTQSSSQSSRGSLLDAINNPSIAIEDLLFLFMGAMTEKAEDRLRKKMEEAANQEAWQAAQERVSVAEESLVEASGSLESALAGGTGASAQEIVERAHGLDAASNEFAAADYEREQIAGGNGKSATLLASEVQMLMNNWKQMSEMTSNLIKSLHDMAMTPIRNAKV